MEALDRNPRPTALIAAGNTLMAGAIRALHELDVRVGTDISFVGCDNVLIAELHQPPIAVVYRDAGAARRTRRQMLMSRSAPSNGGETDRRGRPADRVPPHPSCGPRPA